MALSGPQWLLPYLVLGPVVGPPSWIPPSIENTSNTSKHDSPVEGLDVKMSFLFGKADSTASSRNKTAMATSDAQVRTPEEAGMCLRHIAFHRTNHHTAHHTIGHRIMSVAPP